MATGESEQPAKFRLDRDIKLILALFVSSRLMMLLAVPPENLVGYSDYRYFFNVAELTGRGFWPFVHFWSEYPPIFPYLNVAIYFLAGQQFKNYVLLLAFVLLLADAGNLALLYRLAFRLHGRARAIRIAWIYTALYVPVFFWLSNFDALSTFLILLALTTLLENRRGLLIAALGLGAMLRILPLMLLAAVWRRNGLRAAVGYGLAAVVISLLILLPFLLTSPAMTTASLLSQAGKSSYQTVWALLDGNDTTGNFGPLIDHFDPAKATQPVNNPARIPSWLTILPFAGLGLFWLTRPRRLPDINLDALVFTALTFVVFFLWSPGWSPQWQLFLIPLLLLTLIENRAVLFIIVLGFVNFLEWPVILSRGLPQLLPLTIIIRTLLFGLLAFELYQIFQPGILADKRDRESKL